MEKPTETKAAEKTELEKAQELIAQARQGELQEFAQKLDALCKEYKVILEQGPITIKAL